MSKMFRRLSSRICLSQLGASKAPSRADVQQISRISPLLSRFRPNMIMQRAPSLTTRMKGTVTQRIAKHSSASNAAVLWVYASAALLGGAASLVCAGTYKHLDMKDERDRCLRERRSVSESRLRHIEEMEHIDQQAQTAVIGLGAGLLMAQSAMRLGLVASPAILAVGAPTAATGISPLLSTLVAISSFAIPEPLISLPLLIISHSVSLISDQRGVHKASALPKWWFKVRRKSGTVILSSLIAAFAAKLYERKVDIGMGAFH